MTKTNTTTTTKATTTTTTNTKATTTTMTRRRMDNFAKALAADAFGHRHGTGGGKWSHHF